MTNAGLSFELVSTKKSNFQPLLMTLMQMRWIGAIAPDLHDIYPKCLKLKIRSIDFVKKLTDTNTNWAKV